MIMKTNFQCVSSLPIDGQNYEFDPPLLQERATKIMVVFEGADGHVRVYRVCLVTSYIVECRPDCQLLEIDDRKVIVSAPESIRQPYIPFHAKVLRWLAQT
jgi:hypothetical protein